MPLVKGEGLVLRTFNVGEWDRLAVVLAPGRGKLRLMVKGARKLQGRYSSVMQPLTHLQFTAYLGGRMPTLSQAEPLESFRALRENLDSLAYALYILECVDLVLVDDQPHDDIFSLTVSMLRILSFTERRELLLSFFELRLLARLGFALSLDSCPRCGGQRGGSLVVDLPGFPCSSCQTMESPSPRIKVSAVAMELLALLSGGDWPAIENLTAPVLGEREVAALLDRVMFAKLERKPESHRFLTTIRDSLTTHN